MITDSKSRFSSRVADYVRYRPSYPHAILPYLHAEWAFTPNSVVADIGAGTGISTSLFLSNGNTVYAVEPNPDMRQAMESALSANPRFHSIPGSAESTTLPDHSVDFISCAQAFHWFDGPAAKKEFARIGKPNAVVCLIWNERRTAGSALAEGYESLLHQFGTDYTAVSHHHLSPEETLSFLGPGATEFTLANAQQLDFDGLVGRVLSSSYMPLPNTPAHAQLLSALRDLFDRTQSDGQVTVEYDTRLYCARINTQ